MDTPLFVQFGQLTDAGREVVEHIQQTVSVQYQLYESVGDLNVLNAMPGHYKDFYVHVLQAKTMTAAEWLRDRPTAALVAWQNMREAAEDAEQKAQLKENVDATATLEERILALEAKLTEALAKLEEQAPDATPPAKRTTRRKKAEDTEEEPADPAAETDAEGDADDAEGDGK